MPPCLLFPDRVSRRGDARLGFSLLEVVSALGIVALLAAVGVGLAPALSHRSARVRAEADLAVLASALEAYRLAWGDYPQTGAWPAFVGPSGPVIPETAEAGLHAALCGRLGPTLRPAGVAAFLAPGAVPTLLGAEHGTDPSAGEVPDVFIDPWGRPYVYAYRAPDPAPWPAAGYHLYSRGPDGEDQPPTGGRYDALHPKNGDNLHALP